MARISSAGGIDVTQFDPERSSAKKSPSTFTSRFLLATLTDVEAQGSNRQTDAKALGLCQQVAKPACRLLSGGAPTRCTNSASISDEEVGPG
jgi:hypothetical protein